MTIPLLKFPLIIFKTKHLMGDETADDMKYGDLNEQQLRNEYHLERVSDTIDPWRNEFFIPGVTQFPQPLSDDEVVSNLFSDFRMESAKLTFLGYRHIFLEMVDRLQDRTPGIYTSEDLNCAAKELIEGDKSTNSTYMAIKKVLDKNIDFDAGGYPESLRSELTGVIADKVLPKFDRMRDKFNGLGLTVHDTYATHITITSLSVTNNTYEAKIHYRIQDHFGLDGNDVTHWLYSHWDVFKIWFVLQHYDKKGFAFKPFITEINTTVIISGVKGYYF
ncbi:DUF3289 family protein [Salmonella enterica subsp. enterica serovar Carswell]|nr:DUF3289 family protein [Salmonella enterica subsp. enterica serovar Mississippi]EJT9340263.1 DUF3289 family protein [Salmonella enterica]EKA9975883.1 DUF3289 family protein [Salmonella enterica subsp. enterica]